MGVDHGALTLVADIFLDLLLLFIIKFWRCSCTIDFAVHGGELAM